MSATNVWNKIFCGVVALGLAFGAQAAMAADEFCPECPPDKDGSIFPGGSCENCDRPKSDKAVRIVDGTRVKNCPDCPVPVFRTRNYPAAQPRYKRHALGMDFFAAAAELENDGNRTDDVNNGKQNDECAQKLAQVEFGKHIFYFLKQNCVDEMFW